jgi:hypothetical protein
MTNTPTATHAYNGGRRRTIALVMLVVVALVAASLVITHYLRGKAIEQSGETVTSANGSVSVTFGPGEVDRRTASTSRWVLAALPRRTWWRRSAVPSTSPR